jgi:curved DNA-binding protein CbpA
MPTPEIRMKGQLGKHPLAELIREIAAAKLAGSLRLARERVKVSVYFQDGELIFATSNLRTHRLSEVLQRNRILSDQQLAGLPAAAADNELATALVQRGTLKSDALARIRGHQVSDVLRLALLWTDGTWEFHPRVRLADDSRVRIDVNRLLLECARHLPADFVASRFDGTNGMLSRTNEGSKANLLPAEASVLSHATAPVTLAELAARSELGQEESLRTIYALSLSGLLKRSDWSSASLAGRSDGTGSRRSERTAPPASDRPLESGSFDAATRAIDESGELEALFARLERATDYYEVLDLGKLASAEEIKAAYHTLARRYHPDRFHQSEPKLRRRVDSAFARIAQAYETLRDQQVRGAYDAKRASQSPRAGGHKSAPPEKSPAGAAQPSPGAEISQAESSFQRGKAALEQNRRDEALRFLAEAAMSAPREARYRAHYGQALIGQMNTRRIAEAELQAAVSLEPDNASYRVMLAELYKALGLRRRAEGELQRALTADPKNEAARSLLSSLKSED